MKVNINRQAAGLEDLLFGVGTVQQSRQGVLVTVTRINASNMPFNETQTLAEVLVPITDQIIPNLAEILLADDNAVLATAKALEASNSAIAAAGSVLSAASLLDQFDDRYLGDKAVEPLVDNDGNILLVGALYWNTILNKLQIWDGLIWSNALTLTDTSISTVINKNLDSITNQIGADHVHYKVRNNTASIIPIGTVVTASGTQPGTDYINVLPITDPQTQIAIGIVHTVLAINGSGLVINTGIVDDFDTSAWVVGTILYPDTTGSFTTIKPTSGRYQACALVLRQHLTQGTLLCEFTNPEQIASTTQEGYVQLNDTLTSISTAQALTAAQGKVLQDTTEKLSNKGIANGYAPLDANLKVPAENLPSYVDDVLEYTNLIAFPVTGTSGIIYIAIDTNRSYRWSGTAYTDITGKVDSVNGYSGTVVLTASDVGLGNVENISTATLVHKDSDTGAMASPSGTILERPVTPAVGWERWNTELNKKEIWNGAIWTGIGGGATGGGADTVFVETSYNVTQSYNLTTGKSAFTVGDYLGNVYLADNAYVTVPDNSNWVIQGN